MSRVSIRRMYVDELGKVFASLQLANFDAVRLDERIVRVNSHGASLNVQYDEASRAFVVSPEGTVAAAARVSCRSVDATIATIKSWGRK